MSLHQPKSKAQAINDIKNDVISRYLKSAHSGLINPNEIYLIRAEQQIKRLKGSDFVVDDFISYYSALAIVAAARGNLDQAKTLYSKVIDLRPNDLDHLSNYNNTLVGACRFSEAQDFIEDYFANKDMNYEILFNLYVCNLRNLDFRNFIKYYEKIRFKDVLSIKTKKELEVIYNFSGQLDSLIEDLPSIGIDIKTYSEFFDVLYSFHRKYLYDSFNIRFSIENDDEQYLIVEVIANISIEECLFLTSKFESVLVDYAVKTNRDDILSKFLVYYKNQEIIQEVEGYCSNSIYLGMSEGLVV